MNSVVRTSVKKVLRLTVDGSMMRNREQIVITSDVFTRALRDLGVQIKTSDILPNNGLVIKIKNIM